MKGRLVFFCLEFEPDAGGLRDELDGLLGELGFEEATLERVAGPDGLSEAGWATLEVELPSDAAHGLGRVSERLGDLTRQLARALGDRALGVYVDGTGGGRAALHGARSPRSSEGEAFHVVRQAAAWMETDPNALARYFSAYAVHNELAGPVDLSAADTGEAEEDRFVEAKLRQAREYMEQYLSRRKG
jgi:hypothetical protein